MHKTKNSLSQNVRHQTIELLNQNLALALDLKLQSKQAHWNVKGPNFIGLHELFDTVATSADEFADLMAERVTSLGGIAEGTLAAVSKRTMLTAYSLKISAGLDHVEALSSSLAAFGKSARDAIDEATGIGDADTADIFTEVSRAADKQLWMVEAHAEAKS